MLPKLSSGKIKLIILANDIGKTQRKRFLDKASYYNVPVVFYENKEYLGFLLRKSFVSALGIEDKNLASAILNLREGDDNGEEKYE